LRTNGVLTSAYAKAFAFAKASADKTAGEPALSSFWEEREKIGGSVEALARPRQTI
jgi:hypothetical protein